MSVAKLSLLRRLAIALVILTAAPVATGAETKSSVGSLLTSDTVGFLHVRLADVWDSPHLAFYRKLLGSLGAEEIKAFDRRFAPGLSNIESLTIVMPSLNIRMPMPDGRPVGQSMLWAITTKQPVDRVSLIQGLGLDARTKTHHGVDYLFEEAHWAGIMQLDPTTLVFGAEDSITRLIEQREATPIAESTLAKILAREGSKQAGLLAVNPATFATPEFLKGLPESLHPLVQASSVWAALDLKQESHLSLTLEFASPDRLTAGKESVIVLRKMAHDLIDKGLKSLQDEEMRATKRPVMSPLDMNASFVPTIGRAALKYLDANMKNLEFAAHENTLKASLNLSEFFPAHGDALAVLLFSGVAQFGGSYYTSYHGGANEEIPYYIRDQFQRLSTALLAYHADKGNFPPVALYDKDGKALLSWRVLILPYMEQRPGDLPQEGDGPFTAVKVQAFNEVKGGGQPPVQQTFADLFKQFKLDEPWDSLHNKKLIERMPRPFRIEFTATNWRMHLEWKTGAQVFSGATTLFPGRNGVSKGQVRDGIDSTIAVLFRDDAASAVPWTKPADIPFSADKPLPKLFQIPSAMQQVPHINDSSRVTPSLFAIMADGQIRRFPSDFDEKDFKGLITINGGEKVTLPEPKRKPAEYKETKEFRKE